MTKSRFALAAIAVLVSQPAWSEALSSKAVMTQATAQAMINACFAAQEKAGHSKVNVAIVDDGGQLIAAARQDGACKACMEIARNKAVTSALYFAPTRVFADLSFGQKRDGVNAGLPGAAFVPGLVAFAGGLPITTGKGDAIGGIGVSGASEDEDENCSKAAMDAVAETLK